MTPAAHALLDGLIDYAGLFPPADLDLGDAVGRYAEHRASPERWMLARFIIPAGQLESLESPDMSSGPWHLSVLGHAPGPDEPWADAAHRTLETARAAERREEGIVADRFELRLPADLARDPDALTDALVALDADYRQGGGTGPRAALEVPFLSAPDAVGPAAQAVVDANGRAERPAFALKLRCGGVTPDLVPEVEALACALATIRDAGTPYKATAGLHHPLPNHDDAVGARMHGFLGVFGGAVLARIHGLGPDDWAEILDDSNPANWSIQDGLRWRSLSATAAEVADARAQLALSFGSCSFDEPVDDLRQLGWL